MSAGSGKWLDVIVLCAILDSLPLTIGRPFLKILLSRKVDGLSPLCRLRTLLAFRLRLPDVPTKDA